MAEIMSDLILRQVEEIVEGETCGICNLTKTWCIKPQPDCPHCHIAHVNGWFNEDEEVEE